MKSTATTVDEYLRELTPERRAAIQTVREVILRNLPVGYDEVMNWGMISYEVPLSVYPDTYNRKPLMYAALSSQKNYMSVYLIAIYMTNEAREEFEAAYRRSGKPLDVGQSCVRFRKVEDLPLDLIGSTIASTSVAAFVNGWKALAQTRRTTAKRK